MSEKEARWRRGRRALVGPRFVVGFATVMALVVYAIFPSGREYAELPRTAGVSAYSIAYLTVLTRADPDDRELRRVYARQLADIGRYREALEVLDDAPRAVREEPMAGAFRLELLLAHARSMRDGSPERAQAFEKVHAALTECATTSPKQPLELATLALELEDPRLAAELFVVAARQGDALERAPRFATAGRWFRAAGQSVAAATYYVRAASETRSADEKRRYLLGAASALEASTGACAAAQMLDAHAAGSNDVLLVRHTVGALRACSRVHDAKVMGRRLVELSKAEGEPELEPGANEPTGHAAEMKRQVRRELEAGDPAGALRLLRQLVAQAPRDPELRATAARVAEWASQPDVALTQWLWLLERGYPQTARTMR